MVVEALIVIVLTMLVAAGLAIARLRTLFPVAMLTALFSFLSATVFMLMNAVDVALTEAAVGAGITTVLLVGTLGLTRARERPVPRARTLRALLVTVLTGAMLIYASLDLPHYGDADTPVQQHPLRDRYLVASREEIDIPNLVTAVLTSYRGHDTLGEVTVIFTAGVGIFMLLGIGRRRG